MLRHLWSLAIEEQFYVAWPLIAMAGFALLPRKLFASSLVLLGLGSALLMAILFESGADPSRLYYGTDTRASGLLLGAALALTWQPGIGGRVRRWRVHSIEVAGLFALLGLGATSLLLTESSGWLYRGGFLAVDMLTIIAIVAATYPAARLGPWVGILPMRWIGLRSYGLYLWHWPIILIVAVLGSILGGLASPTEAAAVGAVGAVMLAGYRTDRARGAPILLAAASMAGLLALTAVFDLRMQRDVISPLEWTAISTAVVLSAVLALGLLLAVVRVYNARTDGGERVLPSVMQSTTIISSMVFIILIGAAMFSLVFRGFGGDLWIEDFLHSLPGGVFTAMLLVMAVMFVMGFFLDFLEIIFIVVPIVSPILLQMEMGNGELMSPVWLGIMMAINLQTSFLTPPFGFALFYLRGVAPAEVKTLDIYRGIVPFVIIQIFALAVIALLPGVATWLPLTLYGR